MYSSFHHHPATPDTYWAFTPHVSQFPVSSVRCESYSPPTPPPSAARRNSPTAGLSLAASVHTPSTSFPREIARGVWSDGTCDANHPDVQDYLSRLRSSKSPVSQHNASIFALAALSVFYHPTEITHWRFWSADKRQRTAEIVNDVYFHQPRLIRSPTAWVGIPESLNLLSNHQASHRESLKEKKWYSSFVPPAGVSPPRVRTLRKRKAPAFPAGESAALAIEKGSADIAAPPPAKKARTGRAAAGSALAEVQNHVASAVDDTPALPTTNPKKSKKKATTLRTAPPAASPAPIISPPLAPSAAPIPAPAPSRSNSRPQIPLPTRASARQRARKDAQSTSPEPRTADPARDRSSSLSSAETAVSCPSRHRRSASDFSARTVIVGPGSAKGEEVEVGICPADEDGERAAVEIVLAPRRSARRATTRTPLEVSAPVATLPARSKASTPGIVDKEQVRPTGRRKTAKQSART